MDYERPGDGGLSDGFGLQLPAGWGQAPQPPPQQQVFQQQQIFPAAAPRSYTGTYTPASDVSVNTPPNFIIVVNLHGGPGIHSPITLPPNIRVGYPYEPRERCTSLWASAIMPRSLDWRSFFHSGNTRSKHKPYQFFSQIDNKFISGSNTMPYHVYYYIRQPNNQYALMSYLRLNKMILDKNGFDRRTMTNFNSDKIDFQLKDLIDNIKLNYGATTAAIIMNTCDSYEGSNTRSVYQTPNLRIFNSVNNQSRKNRRGLKRKTRKNKA
jgi:hypothetical protein